MNFSKYEISKKNLSNYEISKKKTFAKHEILTK